MFGVQVADFREATGSRPAGLNSVNLAVSPCPSQPLLSLESSPLGIPWQRKTPI